MQKATISGVPRFHACSHQQSRFAAPFFTHDGENVGASLSLQPSDLHKGEHYAEQDFLYFVLDWDYFYFTSNLDTDDDDAGDSIPDLMPALDVEDFDVSLSSVVAIALVKDVLAFISKTKHIKKSRRCTCSILASPRNVMPSAMPWPPMPALESPHVPVPSTESLFARLNRVSIDEDHLQDLEDRFLEDRVLVALSKIRQERVRLWFHQHYTRIYCSGLWANTRRQVEAEQIKMRIRCAEDEYRILMAEYTL
ncbi:hypothetical protein C8R43DRAFT_1143612 [Mycena crocata]|nr:hypothetical protein C8R43DRAFT_1143612 [Mycena crocata]